MLQSCVRRQLTSVFFRLAVAAFLPPAPFAVRHGSPTSPSAVSQAVGSRPPSGWSVPLRPPPIEPADQPRVRASNRCWTASCCRRQTDATNPIYLRQTDRWSHLHRQRSVTLIRCTKWLLFRRRRPGVRRSHDAQNHTHVARWTKLLAVVDTSCAMQSTSQSRRSATVYAISLAPNDEPTLVVHERRATNPLTSRRQWIRQSMTSFRPGRRTALSL
jgi:hypothetical protein